jgi:hypothetical protein
VVVAIDIEIDDLLHAPLIGKRLRPEWIDAVNGRALRIDRLDALSARRLVLRRLRPAAARAHGHGKSAEQFESGRSRFHGRGRHV